MHDPVVDTHCNSARISSCMAAWRWCRDGEFHGEVSGGKIGRNDGCCLPSHVFLGKGMRESGTQTQRWMALRGAGRMKQDGIPVLAVSKNASSAAKVLLGNQS